MKKYKEPEFMKELHEIRRDMSKLSDRELLKKLRRTFLAVTKNNRNEKI